jgi:hypothetical protein
VLRGIERPEASLEEFKSGTELELGGGAGANVQQLVLPSTPPSQPQPSQPSRPFPESQPQPFLEPGSPRPPAAGPERAPQTR